MTYGNKSNRQLLSVFGFALAYNRFNYARIKVYLSQLVQGELQHLIETDRDKAIKFKLRPSCVCQGMG